MSDIVVHYDGNLRCRAEHEESGTIIITDVPRDNHGLGESFSPSDLLSVALGSCILSMMGLAARAMNIDMAGASASVSKEMANAPRRIARIAVEITPSCDLTDEERARLEAAAHGCPVHAVLGIDAPLVFHWARD